MHIYTSNHICYGQSNNVGLREHRFSTANTVYADE